MFKKIITTGAIALLTTTASAQDFYGQAFGGFATLQDPSFSGAIGGNPNSVEVESDDGFNFGIAVGRELTDFGNGLSLRGEVELSYSDNDATEAFFSGNGPAAEVNLDGGIATTRLFGNLIVDYDTQTAFTPYAGVGVGFSRSELDVVYGPGVALDDTSDNTSAQLILGTAYALSDTLSLTGDVRYIRDYDVTTDRIAPNGALTGVISDDVDTVSVNVGLSFAF